MAQSIYSIRRMYQKPTGEAFSISVTRAYQNKMVPGRCSLDFWRILVRGKYNNVFYMHLAFNLGIYSTKTNSVDFLYISDQKTENVTHYTWDHSNVVTDFPGMQMHPLVFIFYRKLLPSCVNIQDSKAILRAILYVTLQPQDWTKLE